MAVPMDSRKLDQAANDELRQRFPELFKYRETTFSGLEYNLIFTPTAQGVGKVRYVRPDLRRWQAEARIGSLGRPCGSLPAR
jgi:hypothetical protein